MTARETLNWKGMEKRVNLFDIEEQSVNGNLSKEFDEPRKTSGMLQRA